MTYYTYTHATPDGEVFYVGKGTGRRVYSMAERPWYWKEVVDKHDGILMCIVKRFDTEQEAFEHEQFLIQDYKGKGFSLVNQTEGGAGPYGFQQSPESRYKKSVKMTGYKHEIVSCPVCGEVGGETSMKRWHFDNCSGIRPKYKVRATVFGKRVYLGKEHTKEEADLSAKEFYDFVMEEFQDITNRRVPSTSIWTVV